MLCIKFVLLIYFIQSWIWLNQCLNFIFIQSCIWIFQCVSVVLTVIQASRSSLALALYTLGSLSAVQEKLRVELEKLLVKYVSVLHYYLSCRIHNKLNCKIHYITVFFSQNHATNFLLIFMLVYWLLFRLQFSWYKIN